MNLRDYQLTAIEKIRAARRAGGKRILFQLPTGGGKSAIGCKMMAGVLERGKRALVIAHRQELISQFHSALKRDWAIDAGVIRAGDLRANPAAPCQLASLQTLIRRDLPPADFILVDEAHRSPAESYQQILKGYPGAFIVGLTATPARLDGKPLQETWERLIVGATYSELIAYRGRTGERAIMRPEMWRAKKLPELGKVKRVAGEYSGQELGQAMSMVVGDVVESWREHAHGRATVAFAASIEHSIELVARLREAGARAAHIDGHSSDDDRWQALVDLETGKLDVVSNVDVLSEGWDQPRVKCLLDCAPTMSLVKFMQRAGRILRPFEDQTPVIVDHAGNIERHGYPHEDREWSLEGEAKRASDSAVRVCGKCFAYVDRLPCELCGYAAPAVEKKSRKIKHVDGVLERIDANIAAEKTVAKDPARLFFDMKFAEARNKGFKPGWISVKYKDKYGHWPPWSWSQEVKASFDSDWSRRCEERAKDREKWHQPTSAAKPEPEQEPKDAEEPDAQISLLG